MRRGPAADGRLGRIDGSPVTNGLRSVGMRAMRTPEQPIKIHADLPKDTSRPHDEQPQSTQRAALALLNFVLMPRRMAGPS